jgi:hypothetical protein
MENKELEQILISDGYFNLKEVDGIIIGLYKFMFTIGLMVDIKVESGFGQQISSYKYRYCYPYDKSLECLMDLELYDGIGDPIGGWVKQKGYGIDRVNPQIEKDWINNRK